MGVVMVPQHLAPSARAQALGGVLADAIVQFQRENGAVSALEVQQALQVAFAKSQGGQRSSPVALAVVAAIALAGGMMALAAQRTGGEGMNMLPYIFVVMTILLGVFLVIRLRRG